MRLRLRFSRRSLALLAVALTALEAGGGLVHADNLPARIAEPSGNFRTWTFEPSTISARTGDTIVWTNTGSAPHTVTANDGTFDSGNMAPGAVFSWPATAAGTFAYMCVYHPWMVGTVVVSDAATDVPSAPVDQPESSDVASDPGTDAPSAPVEQPGSSDTDPDDSCGGC